MCITIPATATVKAIGQGTPPDTTTLVWTDAQSLSLGAAGWEEYIRQEQLSPTTPKFMPANSSGWSVTLPGSAKPVRASPCTPS